MLIKRLYNLPERQVDCLNGLKSQLDISASELVRRMIDRCCQEQQLNEMFPTMSGQLAAPGGTQK